MEFPTPVSDVEFLARFVLEKSKYRPSDNTARHNLFLPAKDNVLSVFRVDELNETQTVALGEKFVGKPQARPILAYANLRAQEYKVIGLILTPTVEPHPRHVDVLGWADHAVNLNKAHILASRSVLVLNRT